MEASRVVLVDGGPPLALGDGEGGRFTYTLLPMGKFYDKRYGVVDIRPEMLGEMERNFGAHPSYEVPVKLGHGDGAQSPGRVLSARATGAGLVIEMDVDDETADAIRKKRYRYMSAEYVPDYMDKRTGRHVGAVLLGAALVNQPADPHMEPLVLADDIEPARAEEEAKMANDEALGLLKEELKEARSQIEAVRKELEAVKSEAATREAEAKEREEEAKAKADEAQARIADLEAAATESAAREVAGQERISALEAENASLVAEREKAETAHAKAEAEAFCAGWARKGIPPAVVDKVKPVLLSEGRPSVVKLSDTEETPLMQVFADVFECMVKFPMGQMSLSEDVGVELSDVDRARKMGERIASRVNGTMKKEAK